MLRTSRSIRNNRMAGFNSTADMPVIFDPLALPGLKLWLDASQITGLSDGNSVTTWNDMSGNSNTATASSKPIYKTAILNGNPVLRFNGSGNYFSLATNFSGGDDSYVFMVLNYTAGGNPYKGAFIAQKVGLYSTLSPSGNWGIYTSGSSLSGQTLTSTHKLVSAIIRTANDIDMYTNGANKVTSAVGSSYSGRGSTAIGADPASSQFHTGDIAEVIAGIGTITSGMLNDVNSYISAKYGIF